jgi:3-hydroxyacyl-[acyl-carrier-protein] dehydratase
MAEKPGAHLSPGRLCPPFAKIRKESRGTMNVIDIQQILKCLPHRYPFLLIDRVIELQEGKSLTAIKNVTFNEPFFNGHFPQHPVMPGVLIIEAMAQAGGILAYKSLPDDDRLHLLAGIDNARFKQMVVPGDQLRLEVEFIRARGSIWKISGIASVAGKVVCTADIMSAQRKIHLD